MPNRESEHIQLRSEEVQEILTKVPHWMIRWGNVLIFLLILLLQLISWFIKYPDIIESKAIITKEIPPQKEFAKLSGKFDSIYVKDKELVYPHQTLAVIENSADYDDVYLLKSVLDTIGLKDNNFEFPLENIPLLFLGELEADYASFENAYLQYKINKEYQPYSSKIIANETSLDELKVRLNNATLQKDINASEMKIKKRELDRYNQLYDKGVISEQEYDNKQLTYLNKKKNFKNITATISQLKEAIAEIKNVSRGTSISSRTERMTLLKKTLQNFHKLKASIKKWEFSYVLSSEIKGTVSFLKYWNKNQTVQQGDLVFSIIPSKDSPYLAKVLAPTRNSGKIETGQRVQISLDNYPQTEFGFLEGSVEKISEFPNEDGFYILDIELPEKLITSYGKRLEFKQEMSGSANIITQELRLIERFFYRLKDIFNR